MTTTTMMMTVRIPLFRSLSIITLKNPYNIITNETPVGLMMTNAIHCGTADTFTWLVYKKGTRHHFLPDLFTASTMGSSY